uniref:GatB/YqeY domain-containing protein n=1 Tax=Tetradesmus obliquus TaxID=3088 RepID=A0A383WBL5_TETOB|eukprot:jgi/Sobl393_1/1386/SZX75027.1
MQQQLNDTAPAAVRLQGRQASCSAPIVSRRGGLQRQLHVSVCCAAAGSDLIVRIKDDMKAAMKAKDAPRLDAIRFLSAAIKQREIELREKGQEEEVELQLLLSYLPAQLSREELAGIVAAAVAEAGASSVKQMGQVMKLVTAKTAGAADGKMVSELVKAALTQK